MIKLYKIFSTIHISNLIIINILLLINYLKIIDNHQILKRDWQSSLPVPLPKPDEYNEGYITKFMNNTIDDNNGDISTIDDIDNNNKINLLNLTINKNHCIPGNNDCLNNFECRSLPSSQYDINFFVCVKIDCNINCNNSMKEIHHHCPNDSKIIEQIIEINGTKCCLHFCNCDETKCIVEKKCPGSRPATLIKGEKIPGKCCDKIECNTYKPRKCFDNFNGEQYDSGESWLRSDDCHRCKCIDGVRKCELINNCPFKCLSNNHTEKLDSEQCCPRCKACIDKNGIKHDDSTHWIDNCERCECNNGKIICNLPYGGQKFCDRPCTENEHRDWQIDKCCDKCKCLLNCPYGFQLNSTDNNHSKLCKCNDYKINDEIIRLNNNNNNNINSQRKNYLNDNDNDDDRIIIITISIIAILIIVVAFLIYLYFAIKKQHSSSSKKFYHKTSSIFVDNNNDDNNEDELTSLNTNQTPT